MTTERIETAPFDFAEDIATLAQKPSTRNDVIPLYTNALLFQYFTRPSQTQTQTRWAVANAAIIDRWSLAGLLYIKKRAWHRAEQIAKEQSRSFTVGSGVVAQ